MKVTENQKKEVKAKGCLFNRDSEDEFNVRIITENGVLTAEQTVCAARAAERFGAGTLTLTTRMTVELPGVKYENIEPLREFIAGCGLKTGGTGDRIRPVTACKGTTCIYGQIDTQAIAKKIHDTYFWQTEELPHKFKIAIGGCPNNCAKPDLNDFGLIGQSRPHIDTDLCRKCGKCERTCKMNAIRREGEEIVTDEDKCNFCGHCIRICPFSAISASEHGVKIVIGGKWGRQRRPATELPGIYTVDEAAEILGKTIAVFRKYGEKKERFSDMINRIGEETVRDEIVQN